MMNKLFRFGALTVSVSGIVPPIPADSLLCPFLIEEGKPNLQIIVFQDETFPIPDDAKEIYFSGIYRVRQKGGRIWAECCTRQGVTVWTYAVLHIDFSAPNKVRLQILQPNFKMTMDNLLSNVMMESLMLAHDRAIFHAATIELNGSAILFTAPSGTGKSTQAELWRKYRGAKIINGDKILLREENGTLLACGLPYAGTSGISQNQTLPVAAIVALQQGRENVICSVPLTQAVKLLTSQICLQPWRAQDILTALDMAQRIASLVPIYHMACLPDVSAVQCLQSVLK